MKSEVQTNQNFQEMLQGENWTFQKKSCVVLSLYLCSYYKCLSNKVCTDRLTKEFQIICDCANYGIINGNSVLRHFAS